MGRETFHTFANMDLPEVREGVMAVVGRMRGWVEFNGKPRRGGRSLQQLRYYFAVVAKSLYIFLKEDCGWELSHKGDAHEWAKREFLKVPIVNRHTGEVVGERTGSTGDLDAVAMADFIERVRKFLAENNVSTPDPDPSWRDGKGIPSERGVTAA